MNYVISQVKKTAKGYPKYGTVFGCTVCVLVNIIGFIVVCLDLSDVYVICFGGIILSAFIAKVGTDELYMHYHYILRLYLLQI